MKSTPTLPQSLNLLPEEDRKRIGRERLWRYLTVVYSFTAAFLVMGATLLLPTYFFLFFQYRSIADQLAAAQLNADSEQTQKTELLIKGTNTKLQRLAAQHALAASPVTQYLQDVITRVPPTITLLSFAYEQQTGAITLQGNAATREDLLTFINKLRAHQDFSHVESPVTNILKERDILFTISFTVSERKRAL
ncbi:MAG: Uncharacterized protein G01um101429_539 [Parcubacteria group bacterium Gr01-1014_29]|nr:MAG: Uncharacterized protein G01um101429_539 [Parcubacteria group bacterium Gr01-1014_29]